MPAPNTSKRRLGAPTTGAGPTADDEANSTSSTSTMPLGQRRRSGVMASAALCLLLVLASAPPTQASASQPRPHGQSQQQRGLNALRDLPMTYGQYLPPWVTSENYGITYSQTPAIPSWFDPAQAGTVLPGWVKYPGPALEAQAGEMYPDVLSYGPDDWAALQAWIYNACPASVCRAADRSFVPDPQEEAAKEAAFRAWAGASSMASQPNTGATWLHYGADHFQWFYLLSRAALANGQGQILKVNTKLSDPAFQVLRNANGKWNRDSLKGMMDTPPGLVHMGMLRFGADQHLEDRLRTQAHAFDYGFGAFSALSPFPANTQRYRGYYPRQLRQGQGPELEQAAPPLSPQAQQLQEQQQATSAPPAVGTPGFAGVATAPMEQEQQEEGKGLRGRLGGGGGRRRRRKRRNRLRHKKKRARTAAAAARRREHKHEHGHEHEHGQAVNGTAPDAAGAAERRERRHEERRARRRQKRREKKQRLKKQGLAPTVPTAVLLRAPEGDKGGLLYPVATFAHKKTTVKEALARMAQRQVDVLAPVIPPGPIGHAPPTPAPVKFKPVVPAYYHGQTQYAKPQRAFPLVVSPPHHLHPKLAAHFGMGPGGPPMDYEHSGMCKNWCPGRRRLHEAEDRAERWVYVYLGHGAQPVGVEGDKGMLGHFHKQKKMHKVTKLIPIDRPAEYYAPPKPTILKPVHRVYTQPEQSVFVIVPRKKAHPWLAKFHGHPFFAAAAGGHH